MSANTAPREGDPPEAVKRTSRFGEFELSSPPSRLSRNGEMIHLRPQVMRALTELVEHPGEVVTRQHLRHTIWRDVEHVEVERGIKTVIRELRKALGDDPQNPRYIETIRGVGYRFVAPEQVKKEPLIRVSPPARGRRARVWTAAAAVVVAVGLLATLAVLLPPDQPSLLMPRMRPTELATDLSPLCGRLNDELAEVMIRQSSGRLQLVHVFGVPEEFSMSPRVARYAVDGHFSRGETEGSYRISLELIDRRDKSVVWIGTYELADADLDGWPPRASRELIEAVAAHS